MSNLSRRSLFGAAAGAAVAGPAAVKSVLDSREVYYGGSVQGAINSTKGMLAYKAQNGALTENPNWLAERLEALVKDRAAFVKESARPSTSAAASRHGIDGLRSVSATNRMRMVEEDQWRRERANSLSWMDKQIDELKKELGIIGYLV